MILPRANIIGLRRLLEVSCLSQLFLTILNLLYTKPNRMAAQNSGGLVVSQEMQNILSQTGYINIARGSKRLQNIYMQREFLKIQCYKTCNHLSTRNLQD